MINQVKELVPHPAKSVLGGWVYTFGTYHSRRTALKHKYSVWSKAVILAKRKHEKVLQQFGVMIATHLEPLLHPGMAYVITPVPGEPDQQCYLFQGQEQSVTEILADCIWNGLADRSRVQVESLLVQVRPKAKPQRQCLTMAERSGNVRDLYGMKPGVMLSRDEGVILVDDVITSGATMAECARVLHQAGTRLILGVAVAKTFQSKSLEILPSLNNGVSPHQNHFVRRGPTSQAATTNQRTINDMR